MVTIAVAASTDIDEVVTFLAANRLPEAGLREHGNDLLVAREDGRLLGTAAVEVYDRDALLRSVATCLTVKEALDWLVSIDPRYDWVESRGVIVIRPVLAWSDTKHFLNRTVHDVKVDERDPADLVHAINRLYSGGEFALPPVPRAVWIPLTFALAHGSVLDLLNEAARAGDLVWHASYVGEVRPYGAPIYTPVTNPSRTDHRR